MQALDQRFGDRREECPCVARRLYRELEVDAATGPAIYGDDASRDKARSLRSQEGNEIGHVPRTSHAAERTDWASSFVIRSLSVDWTWAHCGHEDLIRRTEIRESTREVDEPGVRDPSCHERRHGIASRSADDVDDAPPSARSHVGQCGLSHPDVPHELEAPVVLPYGHRRFQEAAVPDRAGVVHQDVQSTEVTDDLSHHPNGRILRGEVR